MTLGSLAWSVISRSTVCGFHPANALESTALVLESTALVSLKFIKLPERLLHVTIGRPFLHRDGGFCSTNAPVELSLFF